MTKSDISRNQLPFHSQKTNPPEDGDKKIFILKTTFSSCLTLIISAPTLSSHPAPQTLSWFFPSSLGSTHISHCCQTYRSSLDLFRIIRVQSTATTLKPTYSTWKTIPSYARFGQKVGELTTFNCCNTQRSLAKVLSLLMDILFLRIHHY